MDDHRALSIGSWVVSEACVHKAISPLATDKASTPQDALTHESGSLQCSVFGDVVDLSGCLQAVNGRRCEQVVSKEPLRDGAVSLAAVVG